MCEYVSVCLCSNIHEWKITLICVQICINTSTHRLIRYQKPEKKTYSDKKFDDKPMDMNVTKLHK